MSTGVLFSCKSSIPCLSNSGACHRRVPPTFAPVVGFVRTRASYLRVHSPKSAMHARPEGVTKMFVCKSQIKRHDMTPGKMITHALQIAVYNGRIEVMQVFESGGDVKQLHKSHQYQETAVEQGQHTKDGRSTFGCDFRYSTMVPISIHGETRPSRGTPSLSHR